MKKLMPISIVLLTLGMYGCGGSSDSGESSSDSSDGSGLTIYKLNLVGTRLEGREEVATSFPVEIHTDGRLTFPGDGSLVVPLYQCVELKLENAEGYRPGTTDWNLDISHLTEYRYDNGCIGNIESTKPGMVATTDSSSAAISFLPRGDEDISSTRMIQGVSVYFSNGNPEERIDILNGTFTFN